MIRLWWLAAAALATVVEERCVGPPEAKSSNGAGRFACGGAQRNGTYGCAFCEGHEATAHLLSVAERLRQSKEAECKRLVVYRVAFGTKSAAGVRQPAGRRARRAPGRYLRRWPNRTLVNARTVADLHAAHGRCFFTFMLGSDVKGIAKRGGRGGGAAGGSSKLFVEHNHKVDNLDLLIAIDGAQLRGARARDPSGAPRRPARAGLGRTRRTIEGT